MHDGACLGIENNGSSGNFYIQRLAVFSVASFALAVCTVSRNVFSLVAEIHQSGHVVIDGKYYIPASSTVSAVRAARSDIFLPVESYGTVSAFSGLNAYSRFINK